MCCSRLVGREEKRRRGRIKGGMEGGKEEEEWRADEVGRERDGGKEEWRQEE